MPPRVLLLCLVSLAAPAAGEEVSRDLGAHFPGFRSGASGMVCRPMAEKALAALGVLPAR